MFKYFKSELLFFGLLLGLILLSFFLFSTAYFPLVNSDMAVNVLIADSFTLPQDVYWWSQDRYGSFIPLISQPLIRFLGISPMYAISICNYTVITLGFFGFSKLFKHKGTILLFALIWFFPYQRFITFNFFPIGLSYGLFGTSLFFLLRINPYLSLFKNKRNLVYVFLVGLIWLCAVWVSDLLFFTLLTLGITYTLYWVINRNVTYKIKPIISTYLLGMFAIFGIVRWLKSFAILAVPSYGQLNTMWHIRKAVSIIAESVGHVLSFNTDIYISLGGWSILLFLLIGLFLIIKNFRSIFTFKDVWKTFFLADFTAMILVTLLSLWVLLNDMGRWYFVAPYISGTLLIMKLLDTSNWMKSKVVVGSLILLSIPILISTVGRTYNQTGEYRSMSSYLKELEPMGEEIGIVGDFWEAYRLAFRNPERVKSTPHEDSDVRNPWRIRETIDQPRVYFASPNWLTEFSDTINQFGYLFVKDGVSLGFAKSWLCEYRRVEELIPESIYNASNLSFDGGIINDDLSVTFLDTMVHHYYSVHGPKISLLEGRYRLEIYVKDADMEQLSKQVFIDVTLNGGRNTIAKEYLSPSIYDKDKGCFVLNFEADYIMNHVEFRIKERPSLNYRFEKFVLENLERFY